MLFAPKLMVNPAIIYDFLRTPTPARFPHRGRCPLCTGDGYTAQLDIHFNDLWHSCTSCDFTGHTILLLANYMKATPETALAVFVEHTKVRMETPHFFDLRRYPRMLKSAGDFWEIAQRPNPSIDNSQLRLIGNRMGVGDSFVDWINTGAVLGTFGAVVREDLTALCMSAGAVESMNGNGAEDRLELQRPLTGAASRLTVYRLQPTMVISPIRDDLLRICGFSFVGIAGDSLCGGAVSLMFFGTHAKGGLTFTPSCFEMDRDAVVIDDIRVAFSAQARAIRQHGKPAALGLLNIPKRQLTTATTSRNHNYAIRRCNTSSYTAALSNPHHAAALARADGAKVYTGDLNDNALHLIFGSGSVPAIIERISKIGVPWHTAVDLALAKLPNSRYEPYLNQVFSSSAEWRSLVPLLSPAVAARVQSVMQIAVDGVPYRRRLVSRTWNGYVAVSSSENGRRTSGYQANYCCHFETRLRINTGDASLVCGRILIPGTEHELPFLCTDHELAKIANTFTLEKGMPSARFDAGLVRAIIDGLGQPNCVDVPPHVGWDDEKKQFHFGTNEVADGEVRPTAAYDFSNVIESLPAFAGVQLLWPRPVTEFVARGSVDDRGSLATWRLLFGFAELVCNQAVSSAAKHVLVAQGSVQVVRKLLEGVGAVQTRPEGSLHWPRLSNSLGKPGPGAVIMAGTGVASLFAKLIPSAIIATLGDASEDEVDAVGFAAMLHDYLRFASGRKFLLAADESRADDIIRWWTSLGGYCAVTVPPKPSVERLFAAALDGLLQDVEIAGVATEGRYYRLPLSRWFREAKLKAAFPDLAPGDLAAQPIRCGVPVRQAGDHPGMLLVDRDWFDTFVGVNLKARTLPNPSTAIVHPELVACTERPLECP